MAFEQNDMSGSLFKNDKKTQSNQRDYNGSCKINGVEMWISAWVKTGQSGTRFFSMAFEPKQPQQPQQAPPPPQQQYQQPPQGYQQPQYPQPGQSFQQPQQQPAPQPQQPYDSNAGFVSTDNIPF